MKARSTMCVLAPALFILISARQITAQTSPAPEVVPDAAHELTISQKQAIRRIQSEEMKSARPAAIRFAGIASRIYENMLADHPDERLRAKLGAQMKEASWELLTFKGKTIRQIVSVLTPRQRRLVRAEMRKPGAPGDLTEVITHTFNLSAQ